MLMMLMMLISCLEGKTCFYFEKKNAGKNYIDEMTCLLNG